MLKGRADLSSKAKAFSLIVIVSLLAIPVVVFVKKRSMTTIIYVGTDGETSQFLVWNKERSVATLDFKMFIVSTESNFDTTRFESAIGSARFNVSGGTVKSIYVDAPGDTEQYLCSSLRSIGYFSTFGKLLNGRLIPNGVDRSVRAQRVLSDLKCGFRILEGNVDGSSEEVRNVPVECNRVHWVSDCIETVLDDASKIKN